MKRSSNGCPQYHIGIVKRIKRNWLSFCHIHFTVLVQYTLIHTDVYDFSHHPATFRVVAFQSALYGNCQLFNKRSINKLRFYSMETGFFKFIWFLSVYLLILYQQIIHGVIRVFETFVHNNGLC